MLDPRGRRFTAGRDAEIARGNRSERAARRAKLRGGHDWLRRVLVGLMHAAHANLNQWRGAATPRAITGSARRLQRQAAGNQRRCSSGGGGGGGVTQQVAAVEGGAAPRDQVAPIRALP
ncbi:hypothetical protein PHYSODRAFT_324975 [Phytophthora sojae]|uniref:Uncharacterized protein n=1 Tax=Phytophthora sojae (strain P6497) TaxID=1094619 RepID=G4YWS1_PHYSP|nr:hypothetical protein PHYSODRAFT_324975 [Phytophthora sojae]EGZ23791.1 hypothetical protein PHYSODRAFT_324975 [Phytophthora sojae]|eukprot:XP_009519079.1 hypothetical protein PHYSODRAFT_324975 [Phytophthora sojae]